jgi:hypothetical protein
MVRSDLENLPSLLTRVEARESLLQDVGMTDLELGSSWFGISREGDTEVQGFEGLAEITRCHLSGCGDKGPGMEQAANPDLETVFCTLRGIHS